MRIELDRARGARSFERFVRLAWPQIEPNKLKWNWHMSMICEALEAVSRGDILKLLVSVPPGMSKSLLVSTLWPSWDWINSPSRRFITATYAQDISDKNAKLMRDLVLSDWFQKRWPEVKIAKDSVAKVREFSNSSRGWRISTSPGGRATGLHGDVLLFDDLVKAQDAEGRSIVDPRAIEKANDFWFKTMHTRRANPEQTRYVGIMQRLHHEDAAAKCIERGYEHIMLPMEFDPKRKCVIESLGLEDPRTEEGELLNPARFPRDVVDDDRAVMGAATFAAQMNQDPTPPGGMIFKIEHLAEWLKEPKGAREIITVDCAFKDRKDNDLVAIQAWGVKSPNYYLLDQILGHFDVLKTMEKIAEMKDRRPRSTGVYIEDKANGSAVMQILKDTIPGLIAWNPGTASKTSRAEAVAPLVESENVWIPEASRFKWVQPYRTALARFPLIKHDDEVDATTMALLILHKPKHRRYRDAVKRMLGH